MIKFNGDVVLKNYQEFRGCIAWLGHKNGLKNDLTIESNLNFELNLRKKSNTTISKAIDIVGLNDLHDVPVRLLSAGQKKRAALARLLISDTRIWLLDEPYANLDKKGIELVNHLISQHSNEKGITIVASHDQIMGSQTAKRLDL